MPIRPDQRTRYPIHWPLISEAVRRRAGNRCETCGIPNRAWGWRDPDGTFQQVSIQQMREAGYTRPPFVLRSAEGRDLRIIEIVIGVAHLDHHPEHNDPANLAALCQLHHLLHDQRQHQRTARTTRRLAMATLDLFEGLAR